MAIRPYLAMTAEEIVKTDLLPPNSALMCCPFSETPPRLPDSGVLVLTDSRPADPQLSDSCIVEILQKYPVMVIVDFQKPKTAAALDFIGNLLDSLPCPVYVSDRYADAFSCPVFLSPVPLDVRLEDHIHPWKHREICLDVSGEGVRIRVTQDGAEYTHLPGYRSNVRGFFASYLHCHYSAATAQDTAEFLLWRTEEDMTALLDEAEKLGIKHAIGLYQELAQKKNRSGFPERL